MTPARLPAQQVLPPAQMPPLPLTQLDQRGGAADLDNRAFTLTFAQPVPITDLLLLLVRGTSLSVVPDPSVTGSFIGELKNVTVRQALGLILQPFGFGYTLDGTFIRVFKRVPETRIFDINYVATERVSASTVIGGDDPARSSAKVVSSTKTDLFGDLEKGVQTLLLVTDLTPAERAAPRPSLTGLRVTDLAKLTSLLAAQGTVTTLTSQRLLTLNNEPAIVHTDAATFTVTPQIAGDAVVMLSLSPLVKAPALAEADMIARVLLTPRIVTGVAIQ